MTLDVAGGRGPSARVNALYRGFEMMLPGRDPRDALVITPRICGICSISQSATAARAPGDAMEPTPLGAQIHAAENTADHLTHFHLSVMPDFARPRSAAQPWHSRAADRFAALEGSAQRSAIAARADPLHVTGLLAGKWPHMLAIRPGGVTRAPGALDKSRPAATLRALPRDLESTLFGGKVKDFAVLATPVALMRRPGCNVALFLKIVTGPGLSGMGRDLSFGACPGEAGPAFAPGVRAGGLRPFDPAGIFEDLSHARKTVDHAHPAQGQTDPDEAMTAPAQSWCKAPRPAQRLLRLAWTWIRMEAIVARLTPGAMFMAQGNLPRDWLSIGLVDAARRALRHWQRIEAGRIAHHLIIAPTTCNFSLRDASGTPGPREAALVGSGVGPGETPPLTAQSNMRSFDPCIACAVH